MRFSSIVLASLTVFAAASLAAQVPASHALAARGESSDDNGESTFNEQGDNYSPDSGDSTYGSDNVDCPDEEKPKFPKNRLPKTKTHGWGGRKPESMEETDSYGNDDDDKKLPKHKEEESTYGEDTDKWSGGDGGDNKEWPKHEDETSTYGNDGDKWSDGDDDSDHGSKGKKWSQDSYNNDGEDSSYGDDDDGHWSGGDGRSSGKSSSGGDGVWSKGDGWNNGNRPSTHRIPMPKNDFCPDCGDGWDQPCQYDDDGVYQEGGAMNKCPTKVVKHYNNGDNQCYSGSMGGSGPLIGALIGNCIDACILSNDCPDQRRDCQTPNNLIGQIINIEALNCLTLRALSTG